MIEEYSRMIYLVIVLVAVVVIIAFIITIIIALKKKKNKKVICIKCGNKIDKDSKFCKYCGIKIN